LASGSMDKSVCLWDTQSGSLITQLKGHTQGVSSVAYRRDGQQIASGSLDKTVRLWDLINGTEVAQLKHGDWVSSVAYQGDSHQLASGCKYSVYLWDLRNFEQVGELRGPSQPINCITYREDGLQLAVGDQSGTIFVWSSLSLNSTRWTLIYRLTTAFELIAVNTDFRGVDLSPSNHKLFQQKGSNIGQLPHSSLVPTGILVQ